MSRKAASTVAEHSAPNTNGQQLGEPVLLQLQQVDSSPLNPRKTFDQVALDELAASLQVDGLLQPIVVRPVGGRYVVVAGERRWRAAKRLEWTQIAAVVRTDIDDATHLRLALLENLVRKDLDPLEEAEGYRQLQELGMTQATIAAAVHRAQPTIANAIRLLRAPHEILDRLVAGELTPSHVSSLLRYEAFPAVMRRVAEVVVEEHITSKELDGGLPDAYELEREGLVRSLSSYRAGFDTKVCETCPFDARRSAAGDFRRDDFYCLKPEHFAELQAAADVERQKSAQRQLDKAKASGKQVPKLDKLPQGSFERIPTALPEGCSEACKCRGAGIDYGGTVTQICTDPKRLKKLVTADQRQANAARKAQMNDLLDRLNDKLDLDGNGHRELVIIAMAALSWIQPPDLKEAVKWASGLLEVKDFDYGSRAQLPNKLAALASGDLMRMVVYAVLHHEIRDGFTGYGRGEIPRATWYLGDQPSRPRGKPLVEAFALAPADRPAFDPDDHLASEIAADAERLAAEAELVVAESAP